MTIVLSLFLILLAATFIVLIAGFHRGKPVQGLSEVVSHLPNPQGSAD